MRSAPVNEKSAPKTWTKPALVRVGTISDVAGVTGGAQNKNQAS
ncbi:hypothetical protein ACFO0A_01960 [Novosphingobium tardum]|jgi:hypothetical protein|uniref:Lasso RiPP family leader peptide-containing protein n=1 Tax=Novosphingobium tardum TaxID=1538021 RepID=A0ABV8RKI7_9SPHN